MAVGGGKVRGHALAQQSCSAGAPPFVGDVVMSMPARWLNSSPARCDAEPAPVEAKSTLPGFFLDQLHKLGQRLHACALCAPPARSKVHAARHRGQVPERVIGQLHQVRRNGERPHRAEQQHGAIGRRIGHELVRDVAARAALCSTTTTDWPMFSPSFWRDQPRRRVGCATRSKTTTSVTGFGRKVHRAAAPTEPGQRRSLPGRNSS